MIRLELGDERGAARYLLVCARHEPELLDPARGRRGQDARETGGGSMRRSVRRAILLVGVVAVVLWA